MKATCTLTVALLSLAVWGDALARHRDGHHGGGPMHRCGKMLLHAHPDTLQSKLGLDAGQVKRIQAIRKRFVDGKAGIKVSMVKLRAKGPALWQADLPEEAKVLAHMRKMRQLRGKLMEMRVKAVLQALKLLKRDQRKKLRGSCFAGADADVYKGGGGSCKGGSCKGGACGGDCGCPHCRRGK